MSSVFLKFDADERKWKCNGSRLQIPIIKKSLIKIVKCYFVLWKLKGIFFYIFYEFTFDLINSVNFSNVVSQSLETIIVLCLDLLPRSKDKSLFLKLSSFER